MLIHSPLFKFPHAFTTRNGGISKSPFNSLNLGGNEDPVEVIARNREIVCSALNIPFNKVSLLKQVHSATVCIARDQTQEGDALICTEKGRAIAVSAADCYPVLFEDSKNGVIGAAHSGWKGTYHEIVLNVLDAMLEQGAEIPQIKVAIGPGISVDKYEVSWDLIEQFRAAGFSERCFDERHLNLLQCIQESLQKRGLANSQIWALGRCTSENDFYSYRRDQGRTGRMWGIIHLP